MTIWNIYVRWDLSRCLGSKLYGNNELGGVRSVFAKRGVVLHEAADSWENAQIKRVKFCIIMPIYLK